MVKEIIRSLLHRQPDTNKYNFGHVLILGGSPGMVGAPLLAGEAALRVGAGLVTIASDAHTASALEKRVKEIMTFALPESSNPTEDAEALFAFIRERHVTVVVIGPGLSVQSAPLVRTLLDRLHLPIVVDAAGLLAFRGHLSALKKNTANNPDIILTPHRGEYEKLSSSALPQQASRVHEAAADFAKQYEVTLVLKGHRTVVAQADGSVYENKTGNPGLATAGTGDVLSGVVVGLIAQGVKPGDAAVAGTYIHGVAGDLASATKTEPGVIASDVVAALPEALKQVGK